MIHDPVNCSLRLILITISASAHLAASRLFAIGIGSALGKSSCADGSIIDFS